MKRQSDRRQSGFTLFEIMLVISIIGIFFTITLRTNWNPRNNSEKVNLLSVAIAGRLRNEIQAISIGRMPKRDGNTATETRITIGTGGLITRYYSGATEISSGVFLMPFFEGDRKYELARVTWT